jgi:hypothetical protein
VVEMSSSWNFPARASPSYEGSEPSRGTLIFELKGKGHEPSRAENSSARATAQASSARAHHY